MGFLTEKDKMIGSMLHDPYDPEIAKERAKAYDLCDEYNRLNITDAHGQSEILKKLLPNAKGSLRILPPFHCHFGYNIHIGENFFGNFDLMIFDYAKVTIGDNVLVGPRCLFATSTHPMSAQKRRSFKIYAFPITIGSDVWFGADVKVLPGVTIGDGSVIGSGSVVYKDIPSHCLAAGNPARVIRSLTPDEMVGR